MYHFTFKVLSCSHAEHSHMTAVLFPPFVACHPPELLPFMVPAKCPCCPKIEEGCEELHMPLQGQSDFSFLFPLLCGTTLICLLLICFVSLLLACLNFVSLAYFVFLVAWMLRFSCCSQASMSCRLHASYFIVACMRNLDPTPPSYWSPNDLRWVPQFGVRNGLSIGICWSPELHLFVVVMFSDRVLTSVDGFVWEEHAVPNANYVSVAWSPELHLFAAVATGSSHVLTSPNGVDWTQQNIPVPNQEWHSIIWAPELHSFVAVALRFSPDLAMTSVDGVNWQVHDTPAGTSRWRSVTWSADAEMLLAVSYDAAADHVMVSQDGGESWTSFSAGTSTQLWSQVAWSPELGIFVAASSSTDGAQVMTSSDGQNWVVRTTPTSTSTLDWFTLLWAPELHLFLALSLTSGGEHRCMYSSDGVDWQLMEVPASMQQLQLRHAAWSRELGRFVAVAGSLTYPSMTMDIPCSSGTVWRHGRCLCASGYWDPDTGLCALPPCPSTTTSSTVAIRELGDCVPTSCSRSTVCPVHRVTDVSSLQWSPHDTMPPRMWLGVAWSPTLRLFAAVARSAGEDNIMTSTDGVSWTVQTSAPAGVLFRAITWAGGDLNLFVAVGDGGPSRALISPDGVLWHPTTMSSTLSMYDVMWAEELGILMAVGLQLNSALISVNGVDWVPTTLGATSMRTVQWLPSHSRIVVTWFNTGDSTHGLWYSDDGGTTWETPATPIPTNAWYSTTWSPERSLFVAGGVLPQFDPLASSADGVLWDAHPLPPGCSDCDVRHVAWVPDVEFFLVLSMIGSGERFRYSYDGQTWSDMGVVPALPANAWRSSAWSVELGRLVIVASAGDSFRVVTATVACPPGMEWLSPGCVPASCVSDRDWLDQCVASHCAPGWEWSAELSDCLQVS